LSGGRAVAMHRGETGGAGTGKTGLFGDLVENRTILKTLHVAFIALDVLYML